MKALSKIAAALAGLLVAIASSSPAPALAADQITVTAGGGSYQQVLSKVVFAPFSKATGIKIAEDEYDYTLGKVRAMVQSKTVTWDVLYVSDSQARVLCNEGTTEKLDWKRLGLDPAQFPGTDYTECGVPFGIAATAVVYDKDKLPNGPKTMADFFDLKKFPGKRGLYKGSPAVTLEWALVADGVPLKDVYKVLATPEGIERAFRKLDTIKKDVVWWSAGAQPTQLLADGQVAMTMVWHTRVYDAVKNSGKRFELMWDGVLLNGNAWVIPKGSPHLAEAYKFLSYVAQPRTQADVTNNTSSGPINRDAVALVDPAILPFVPNAPSHVSKTMPLNTVYWAEKREELTQRFNNWMAK